MSYGSKAWANEQVSWFCREILYSSTWSAHPFLKVILGVHLAKQLDGLGFWWQAERIRNHIHRWGKTQKEEDFGTLKKENEKIYAAEGGDTLSREREREVSS